MEWVKVSESLPIKNGFYNVYLETEEGNQIHSLWFTDGRWYFDSILWSSDESISSTSFFVDVIQWSELPEKPTD